MSKPRMSKHVRSISISGTIYQTALYLSILGWLVVLLVNIGDWGLKDALFPRSIVLITMLLVVAKLVSLHRSSIFSRIFPDDDEEADKSSRLKDSLEQNEPDNDVSERDVLVMMAWTVSLPVFIYLFGYIYVAPLYLFAFVWFYIGSVRSAAMITVVFSTIMYILFVQVLQFSLWRGLYDLPAPPILF